MLQSSDNWELFGFDVRRVGKYWAAAWREFLWGYDSPLKARLDELVRVRSEQDIALYHAGKRIADNGEAKCEAVLLPEALVLNKTLQMPVAVEDDLEAVMALEVAAYSPFPPDDTGYGWKVVDRSDTGLSVQMVLVSLSSTMRFLGSEYDCHDPRYYEVWAGVNGSALVLEGFGEGKRQQRYRRRLMRVCAFLGYSAMVILLIFGLSAGFKYLELQKVRDIAVIVQRQAADASQIRSSMAMANESIAVANKLLSAHPNPHREVARLTRLLGDDVSVQQFTMTGREIRLRGQASNAAAVMKQLTAVPAYTEVTAPQAIAKLGTTGMERFVLNISLGNPSQ
jgi:hypothetical protein